MDIDPQALIATHDNAVRNGVRERMTLAAEPGLEPGGADVLLANILAGTARRAGAAFAQALRPAARSR